MSQGVRTSPCVKRYQFRCTAWRDSRVDWTERSREKYDHQAHYRSAGSFKRNDRNQSSILKENTEEYRKQIGYIPETPSLYEELTLREHIEVTAMAYDIPMDIAMKRAEKLLETFRLSNRLDWFPANFSKGMKQKVMILCAFLIEPSLYIIDEPFLGLDPLAINALLELMVEMKKKEPVF